MTDRRRPVAGLAAELLAMARADEEMRRELAGEGTLFGGYHPAMEALHVRHAERLEAIVDDHGWPGSGRVGEEASRAAWILLQHAISRPDVQHRGLRWLQEAVARGEAPPVQAAMLEDRVRVLEGRPQLWGTQFDWDDDGALGSLPVDDPARVEERRRALGLPPLAEETARRRAAAAAEGEGPPRDPAARRRAMEEWRRRVGWRA